MATPSKLTKEQLDRIPELRNEIREELKPTFDSYMRIFLGKQITVEPKSTQGGQTIEQ